MATAEYGRTNVKVTKKDVLFEKIPETFVAWMSHGDYVEKLPPGFEILAQSEDKITAAATACSKRRQNNRRGD